MFISFDAATALTEIYPKEIMTDVYNDLIQGGSLSTVDKVKRVKN